MASPSDRAICFVVLPATAGTSQTCAINSHWVDRLVTRSESDIPRYVAAIAQFIATTARRDLSFFAVTALKLC